MNPSKESRKTSKTLLGNYYNLFNCFQGLKLDESKPLSFLNPIWKDLYEYRRKASEKVRKLLYFPYKPLVPKARVKETRLFDGLRVELLEWNLPYGPPAEAYFLKLEKSSGRIPGVLLLHDHGGFKYFGKSKLVRLKNKQHPMVEKHQKIYYGGRAIANELAKKGYGVLVPDVFTFESRKLNYDQIPEIVINRIFQPPGKHRELTPDDIERDKPIEREEKKNVSKKTIKRKIIECLNTDLTLDYKNEIEMIDLYNSVSQHYEEIIAKSFFSMGFCWPALVLFEDTCSLNYLLSRDDIDPERICSCGLSGGGLRTNLIGGLDQRIKCTLTAGFMSTWKDFSSNVCFTHTWMLYVPDLPRYMDYPQLLGLRAPSPSMVLATDKDPLFTLSEVNRAIIKLKKIYNKAGYPDNFNFKLFPGGHKFDVEMQEEAFEWLSKHL